MEGDSEGFREFSKKFSRLLYKIAVRITLDDIGAEQVVRVVLIAWFERSAKFASGQTYSPAETKKWLKKGTLWAACDWRKKHPPNIVRTVSDDNQWIEQTVAAVQASTDQLVFRQAFWDDVGECWRALKIADRTVFRIYFTDLSVEKIADCLLFQRKPGRVTRHKAAVLNQLKSCMHSKGHTNADDAWAP